MAQSLKIGVVSKKSKNRFEWIVSDFFTIPKPEDRLIRSPYFSFKEDSWSVVLHLRSEWCEEVWEDRKFVDVCVGNRNGTRSSPLQVRLEIVGRNGIATEAIVGVTNEVGIFKVEMWLKLEDMVRRAEDTNGRLVIVCELSDLEEPIEPIGRRFGAPIALSFQRSPNWDPIQHACENDPVSYDWADRVSENCEDWSAPANSHWDGSVWEDIRDSDPIQHASENYPVSSDWRDTESDWVPPSIETNATYNYIPSSSSSISNDCAPGTLGVETNANNCASCKLPVVNKKSIDKLLQDLKELMTAEEESDVILKVKDKCFKAHKNILMMRSPVFRSMFKHEMLEKETGEVDIHDCDPETFPDFLNYLYSGSMDNLSPDNVFSLYVTADKYCLQEMKDECVECMKRILSVDTFCDVYDIALRHSEKTLSETCAVLFSDKMNEIIVTAKWRNFICENPCAANDILINTMSTKGNKS